MSDSKEGILPLVGRVIKQRLGEVKEEAAQELGEGLADLEKELRDDLEAGKPKNPTRIAVDKE